MATLKSFVEEELTTWREHRRAGRVAEAWAALERAHILSQPDAWLHTRVHLDMLAYAVALKDWPEFRGQIARIAVAGIGSRLGRAPIGNTGRSDVPILQPMSVAPDLAAKLAEAGHPVETGRDRARP